MEVELQVLLAAHSERRTKSGKLGVVRNGYLPKRELQTGLGLVTVRIPKVRAKTGEPVTFRSASPAVCKEDEIAGVGAALVIPEGDFKW